MSEPILLLSRSLPPATTGVGILVGNLARQFSREELVLVGEQAWNRPPIAWRDEWPEIRYVYHAPPEDARGARWRRRAALPLILWRTLQVARRHGCRKVLATFPSEEFLWVGYQVARRLGAEFYPYFTNTYLDNRRGLEHWIASQFQPQVFREAKHVFAMSEGMVEFYRQRYPNLNCSTLAHTFNEVLPEFAPTPNLSPPLRAVFSGNINASCVDAAARMFEALRQIPDANLTLLTGTRKAELLALGLLRERVEQETVSRDVLLERLSHADLVLLPHGFRGRLSEAEYQTIFPTKTIEYLICGRPILAHSPSNCYLTRFLKEWDCAVVVEEASTEALIAAIQRLRADASLRSRLVRNALCAAQQFQGTRVSADLRRVLFASGARTTVTSIR